MSYLRYLCFLKWCPTHIALSFCFCFSSSCVPYVASFYRLSMLIAPSVFSNVYLQLTLRRVKGG